MKMEILRNMKYIILSLLVSFISCAQTSDIVLQHENSTLLFKILKIRKKEPYYIIYAQRNDSVFKIISEKFGYGVDSKEIKVGGKYQLDLARIYPIDSIFGLPVAPNLGIKYIGLKGGVYISVEEKFYNTIYRAKNLDGLSKIE